MSNHKKMFTVKVMVDGKSFNGTGRSKAAAKEAAAKQVLDYLRCQAGAILPKPLLNRESSVDSNICADDIRQVPGSDYDLQELNPNLYFVVDVGSSQGGQRLSTLSVMGLVVCLIESWYIIKHYGGDYVNLLERTVFIFGLIFTILTVYALHSLLPLRTFCLKNTRFLSPSSSLDTFPCIASSAAWFCAFYSSKLNHLEPRCIYLSMVWIVWAWLLGLANIKDRRSHMMDVLTGLLLGASIGVMVANRTYIHQEFSVPITRQELLCSCICDVRKCNLVINQTNCVNYISHKNITYVLCNCASNATEECKLILNQTNCTNIITNSTINIIS